MFNKILIANRGEIAVRILRACRDLGVPAVVAFSEADRDTLAVQHGRRGDLHRPGRGAQELPEPAGGRVAPRMITGCDAVHPGYGFLSEDAGFAEVCAAHDLHFIGPRAGGARAVREQVRRAPHAGRQRPADRPGQPRRSWATSRDALDQAAARRLPGPAQAIGRWRRPRDAAGPLPARDGDSRCRWRDPRRRPRSATTSVYFEKWIEESRARRGAGADRPARERHSPRRARLQRAAPAPEDHRGGARRRRWTTTARERLRDLAIRSVAGGRLRERRHARVPARRATGTSTSSRSTAASRSSIRSPRC